MSHLFEPASDVRETLDIRLEVRLRSLAFSIDVINPSKSSTEMIEGTGLYPYFCPKMDCKGGNN